MIFDVMRFDQKTGPNTRAAHAQHKSATAVDLSPAPLFCSSVGVFSVAYPPTLYHTGRPDNSCTGRALCVNWPCFERNVRKDWICNTKQMSTIHQ